VFFGEHWDEAWHISLGGEIKRMNIIKSSTNLGFSRKDFYEKSKR